MRHKKEQVAQADGKIKQRFFVVGLTADCRYVKWQGSQANVNLQTREIQMTAFNLFVFVTYTIPRPGREELDSTVVSGSAASIFLNRLRDLTGRDCEGEYKELGLRVDRIERE
jgi:hypothetical protein